MVGRTEADLRAVVQDHAAALLPRGVEPLRRPISDGARRVLQAMRPIGSADLIHGLDVDLPVRSACPTVTTVHDLSVFDTPWAFSRYRATGERLIVGRSIRAADAVIAVSAFTAERIDHHFGRTATVIPLAPPATMAPFDPDRVVEVRRRYDLPPRFVLQVSSIEPRKDVALLADACAELSVPLVLIGGLHGRSKVPDGARHLGYVDRCDIDPLLDAADIVAYISRYEGFGLPPLEAMARARPVVASRVGALPEVADGGAELVAVDDRAELVATIEKLWLDPDRRAQLGDDGRRKAAELSWEATADATLDVYRTLGVTA